MYVMGMPGAQGGWEKGVRFLGTGVMDVCGCSCECWEPNPGPLQEQVLLTAELIVTGPSLVSGF